MDQPQYSLLESYKREVISRRLTEAEIFKNVANNIDYLDAPLPEKLRILVQAIPDVGHQLGLIRRWYEKGLLNHNIYNKVCSELLKIQLQQSKNSYKK